MKSMRILLDLDPFTVEVKVSGPTVNRQLRQSLLQIVDAIDREKVNFKLFQVDPDRTYSFANFSDPVWRAKHSHTITDTRQPGYELRLKRLKLGLSGREFARLLDVHHTHLSHVEHGRRPVSERLRLSAESVYRTQIAKLEQSSNEAGLESNNSPLGFVVHKGQTFFEDLQVAVNSVEELKHFFDRVED